MKSTAPDKTPPRPSDISYHVGLYLAANAVSDCALVVDGPNCIMPKAEYVLGNHDLYSALLSPENRHRLIYTMAGPVADGENPEVRLSALLRGAADSGCFSAVLLTGLPFRKLAGIDHEGLAASAGGKAPVVHVPSLSLEADWLEGYAMGLDALIRALPAAGKKRQKNSVAIAGYLLDRREQDHAANIAELTALLEACGLRVLCVFPSGGTLRQLSRALEADLVISLPYGRRAARRLAGLSGARLVETGLPMGLKGTRRWLETVRRAAGLRGPLPGSVKLMEKTAAAAVAPFAQALAHRNAAFAGDPHLFAGFADLAAGFCMRVTAVFINSRRAPLDASRPPAELLFSPVVGEAAAALARMGTYARPEIMVGNSFAFSEGLADGMSFVELGFPSYGHHCLAPEPFLGFAGVKALAGRLLNAAVAADGRRGI
ncbi:MAG: hypothetical protein FD189_1454 [Elusimicrobia bacterium]|nr:MAG: hypothetical protein FD154_16 [Elusimicrobiota bacterium]KAF0155345.1 MAG: hypothetical protein FD189_1454 [Elusimicrobiota bacterium]